MSRWSPRPCPDEPDGLILFDGVCVFCSRWVRLVMRLDRERRFRFLPGLTVGSATRLDLSPRPAVSAGTSAASVVP